MILSCSPSCRNPILDWNSSFPLSFSSAEGRWLHTNCHQSSPRSLMLLCGSLRKHFEFGHCFPRLFFFLQLFFVRTRYKHERPVTQNVIITKQETRILWIILSFRGQNTRSQLVLGLLCQSETQTKLWGCECTVMFQSEGSINRHEHRHTAGNSAPSGC